MRLTLLLATSILVAGVGLSGCYSSGAPQALPGDSQSVAPMGDSTLHMAAIEVQPKISCSHPQYLACVTVAYGDPGKVSICIASIFYPTCSGGLWYWKQKCETLGGARDIVFRGRIKPNPGNPIIDTISARSYLKNSHGKVVAKQKVTACYYSSCVTVYIGIATD